MKASPTRKAKLARSTSSTERSPKGKGSPRKAARTGPDSGRRPRGAEAKPPRSSATGYEYRDTDFRRQPERYRIGRGEQGVLTAEPYKSELLPLWRFKTEVAAKSSAKALYAAFIAYRAGNDFVGMDMARKFIQMGYTRARRYANHRDGRKYDAAGAVKSRTPDTEKARAAAVFQRVWRKVESDAQYRAARAAWPR